MSDIVSGGGAGARDGRDVVVQSTAGGLCDPAAAGVENVYRKDRLTGALELVTVAADGGPANGDSHDARISDDGNRVVFVSDATNLHAEASTPGERVFVRDIAQGRTIVASRGDGAQGAVVEGQDADISGDGRTVAFATGAALDALDGNGAVDVYARRLAADATILVSR
jgi:dipeptidyl aminopeptidase/acylaminoacyl peptidase